SRWCGRRAAWPPASARPRGEPVAATEETTDRRTLARLQAVVQTLSAQNADLKRLVSIYDRLTGMVLQDAPLEAITRLFAELVGRPVTVLDPLLQPLTCGSAAVHGSPAVAPSAAPALASGCSSGSSTVTGRPTSSANRRVIASRGASCSTMPVSRS